MKWTRRRLIFAGVIVLMAGGVTGLYPRPPEPVQITEGFAITRMADGLTEPWSLAFLPDGGFLVTERDGRLWRFDAAGARHAIAGVPPVFAEGQGGLFDVLVPRDFAQRGEIFLSFANRQGAGEAAGTALARARLGVDRLEDLQILWQMPPGSTGTVHFGGRLAEAPDGTLFLTLGERGAFDPAQDMDALMGKIIHVTRDGNAAAGGPFAGSAHPEIHSLGHRNPQGLAFDGAGQLWASEHGARGGDEINRILPGRNYGWPVIAYGRNYSGTKIGEGTSRPGMEQPAHYWDPSIAPSGHMVYSGKLWPEWTGFHVLGSLKFDYIALVDPTRGWSEAAIRTPDTGRVRDVREAPDGTIWFLSVNSGAVFRIAPGT